MSRIYFTSAIFKLPKMIVNNTVTSCGIRYVDNHERMNKPALYLMHV